MEFLLGCWKRITRLNRSNRSNDANDPKIGILKDARRICHSYAMFTVTLPDMFGREIEEPSPLAHQFSVPMVSFSVPRGLVFCTMGVHFLYHNGPFSVPRGARFLYHKGPFSVPRGPFSVPTYGK